MYLWIGIGGLAGVFARLGMNGLFQRLVGAAFPWGTLVINVTGSLVIGFVARYGTGSASLSPELRAGLMVGFCGAYTTFSTYSYDTVLLLQNGAYLRAGMYAVGSVVLSLGATLLGMAAASRLA